jgi:hypothetical protein
MKKFIISESELTKIIQKSIEKQLNEDNFTEEVIEGADENENDIISKDELHKHFDEDGDGTVTPDEYDDHIRKHIRKELKK